MEHDWSLQINLLTTAYMEMLAQGEQPLEPGPFEYYQMSFSCEFFEGTPDLALQPTHSQTWSGCGALHIAIADDAWPNESLVRIGYLGSTPVNPMYIISLQLLNQFHCLRGHAPRTSIEQFVKAMCTQHKVCLFLCEGTKCLPVMQIRYRHQYSSHFSQAYDVYIRILMEVEKRVLQALGDDGPDHHMKTVCPACTYKVNSDILKTL